MITLICMAFCTITVEANYIIRLLDLKNNKIAIKCLSIKCLLSALGDPCAYISGGQPSWAHLGFWKDRGSHISWILEQMIIEIYFRKYNLELHLFKAFGIWNTELDFTQDKPWLGLDTFCSTRFSLTELVFNWCLELGRNLLRTIGSYFVMFCNVKGETLDFVFRKETMLSIVYNNC